MESKSLKTILFLGLGGAGQRHLRIFNDLYPYCKFIAYRHTNQTPLLTEEFQIESQKKIDEKYPLKLFNELDKAIDLKPDLAVIATPSSTHCKLAVFCAENKINIFVEKPAALNQLEFYKLENSLSINKVGFHIGFQRQYHPFLKRLKNDLKDKKIGEIIKFNVNVSSFMPGWHKYEDYRMLYASKKNLGGGIIFTESHELYFLLDLLGMPQDVTGYKRKDYHFEIEVAYSTVFQLHYKEFIVEVDLSFLSKRTERKIVVNGTSGWIEVDIDNSNYKILENNCNLNNFSLDLSSDHLFKLQANYIFENFQNINEKTLKNLSNMTKVFELWQQLPSY